MTVPTTKPVRSLLVTQSRFDKIGLDGLFSHMKKMGFQFESDTCPPIKLSGPCRVTHGPDSTHFEQWDPPPTRGDET